MLTIETSNKPSVSFVHSLASRFSRTERADMMTLKPQPVKRNQPALLFRDLLSTWHQDASTDRIDMLTAELTACVATSEHSLCVGLIRKDAIEKLFGLVFLFDAFDLVLRYKYRKQDDGAYVFLEKKQACESEFAGTKVTARQRLQVPVLANAA